MRLPLPRLLLVLGTTANVLLLSCSGASIPVLCTVTRCSRAGLVAQSEGHVIVY
jgi:hypothetical protein